MAFIIGINRSFLHSKMFCPVLLTCGQFCFLLCILRPPESDKSVPADIGRLEQWSNTTSFKFLSEKIVCVFNHFRSIFNYAVLRLRNNVLDFKEKVKFLGLSFDQKLTWLSHLKDLKLRWLKALNITDLQGYNISKWRTHCNTRELGCPRWLITLIRYSAFALRLGSPYLPSGNTFSWCNNIIGPYQALVH